MEINVLNVELGVSEAKLTEALASRLHRPPFLRHPKDPLLNFNVHIHVAKEQRRTDWEHHRGTAALILPEYHQGRLFLERFGEERGWVLQGKRLHFSQADRKPAEGLIESLRRLPWLSPDEVEKRNTILDRLSKPIIVRSLDFGRPCRDRVFAAEYHIDYKAKQGKLFFDPEFSLFRISDGKHIMAIRCDTVEHVVADDEANAVLLILRMPPAFEEMPDTSAPTDRPKPPETETLSKKHAPKKAVPGMKAPEPAARPRKLPPGSATPRPIDPHRPGSASPSTSRSIPGLTPSRTPSLSPLGLSTLPLRTPSGLSPPSLSSSPPTGLVSPPGLSVPPSRRMSTASTNGTAMASFAGAVDAALHAVEGGSNGQANGYAWATGHVMNGHATTNGDSNGYGRVSEYGLSNGPAQPWLGLRSRMTRFEEKHRNLAPFSSRAILVSFGQEDAVFDFEEFSERTWTGFPSSKRDPIPIVSDRHLYSAKNRTKIPTWLKKLPLVLAMQLDALFINGVLNPIELFSLHKSIDAYLQTISPKALAHAIQIFAEDVAQKDREYTQERHDADEKDTEVVWGAQLNYLDLLAEAVDRVTGQQAILPVHKYMVRTFHLYLTPSTMILEGPFPSESNRILRLHRDHTDCFLRVTFCEESRREYRWERNERSLLSLRTLLIPSQIDWKTFLKQRVESILNDGCVIAGRHYQFLGYSMSSMRMRTAWFVTPFEQDGQLVTAASIRAGLGDFSKVINAPARYGARIAQAFTATRPSLRLRPDQIRREPDIEGPGGACYTDGAARISRELARKVMQAVGDAFGPSPWHDSYAFQFRMGGAKGVAAIDTQLEGSVLVLRPSTEKFDAPTSLDFEVVLVIWQCRPLTLNQDIIQILEDRGVPSSIFLDLQKRALEDAKAQQASLRQGASLISSHGLGEAFDVPALLRRLARLLPRRDDIDECRDDCEGVGTFLQHCMANAYADICRSLKYKARLPVPGGYLVVGTADETRSLGERQVYCCVTPHDGTPIYIRGPVLVFRSPAVHPGDAQMLEAIGDPPEEYKEFFEHRRNQLVFSVKGPRPLASELGGGDLDGDLFAICTYEPIFPKEDAEPAEYPPTIPNTLDRPAEWRDVVEWLTSYIGGDKLGLLGTRRRLLADQCRSGTKHNRSLKLAELYTASVDAPKSGRLPELDDIPRRIFKLTPDFMQSEDQDAALRDSLHLRRYYESKKSLGVLFRAIPRRFGIKEKMRPPMLPTAIDGTDPDDADFAVDEPVSIALAGAMVEVGIPCKAPTLDEIAFAGRLMARYALELRHISFAHTLTSQPGQGLSESELVMGLIAGPSIGSGQRRTDAVDKASVAAHELVRAIKKQLTAPRKRDPPVAPTTLSGQAMASGEEDLPVLEKEDAPVVPPADVDAGEDVEDEYEDDQGRRAWAAWHVATRTDREKFGVASFGLIALSAVMDAVEEAKRIKREAATNDLKTAVTNAAAEALRAR